MSTAVSSLFRNASFSIFTNLLNRLGNTLIFILIIQFISVDAGGTYNLALAYFFIGSRFAFWGLDHLITREVAKNRSLAGRYIVNYLIMRAGLSFITTIALIFFVQFTGYDQNTQRAINLMLLSIFPEAVNNLCWGVFASFEEYQFTSISSFFNVLLKLGLGYAFVRSGAPLSLIIGGVLLGHWTAMLINLFIVQHRYITGWEKPNWGFIKSQMRISTPFLFIGVFYILDNRMDNILLSFLSTNEAIGLYGAATAIILAVNLIPEGYRIAILPVMARYHQSGHEETRKLYAYSFKFLTLIGLPASVALMIMAKPIIKLIYHQNLLEAALALQIMAIPLAGMFLNVLNNRLLIVYNKQNLLARFLAITASLNFIINIVLMPYYGALGASIGRATSAVGLFILTTWAVTKLLPGINRINYLWQILASCGIMGIVLWLSTPLNIWFQIVIGSSVYFLSLLIMGVFSSEEIILLKQLTSRYSK